MSDHAKSLKIRLEAMRGCGANKCRICDDHANAALVHLSALKDENELLKGQSQRMEEERDQNYRAAATWKDAALRQQEIGMDHEADLIEEREKTVKLRNAVKDALNSLAHNDEFSNPATTRTLQDILNETK